MSTEEEDLTIDPAFQPSADDVSYDLQRALSSVVALRSQISEDALTASMLGTERAGHGVVIGEKGLVLTVGYLVTEAESIWLIDINGLAVPGHAMGYDQETGLGLVQALGQLNVPAIPIGSSSDLAVGDPVILAGHGGTQNATKAKIVSKREFAGYWEYVLDEGIFTSPPHPSWGGAALINADGELCGIGSLFVQQSLPGSERHDGNLIIPIDLLKPILDEMMQFGRRQKAPRPWLGMITTEVNDALVVAGLVDGGPADDSGISVGDIVLGVNGEPVTDLANLFRQIWALGSAGTQVPLNLQRGADQMDVVVNSVSRYDMLKAPNLH
jgi:S1-C subfamily serine protease